MPHFWKNKFRKKQYINEFNSTKLKGGLKPIAKTASGLKPISKKTVSGLKPISKGASCKKNGKGLKILK